LQSDPKYLAAKNDVLLGIIADRDERIKRLKTKVERRDEALCLYSEVVRLYQGRENTRPWEVDRLLERIRALMKN